MSRLVVVLVALALAACADRPASAPMRDGAAVAWPQGWLDYCLRHATDDPRCKPSS